MKPSRIDAWMIAGLFLLTGCNDFAQSRLGSVRKPPEALTQSPPTPSPALSIPNSPTPIRTQPSAEAVQQAAFVQPSAVDPSSDPAMMQQPLRALHQRAAARCAQMDSYIFRLKRREAVDGKSMPEELLQVKVRREPYSVYLKWLGNEGKGREVVYVRGRFDSKMQVRLAPGDPGAILMTRLSLAPDDPMVRAKSRYPITETGFASIVERFGKMMAAQEKNDPREGTAKYLGRLKRPEFQSEVEAVHQVVPAGSDPLLAKGGQRWWYFDPATALPCLVITHDPAGEVEYYCYDHVQFVRLDEHDFNPDQLWKK